MTTEPNFTVASLQKDQSEDKFFNWDGVKEFAHRALGHYKLLIILFVLFSVLGCIYCAVSKPVYVANALIGPPSPSPSTSILSGMDSPISGVSKKLFGGGSQGANDPYQEYLALIRSPRLYKVLIKQDRILPVIFPERWDQEMQAWRKKSLQLGFIRGMFHLPNKDGPNVDDLKRYMENHLSVSEVSPSGSAPTLSSATYTQVSFRYRDPAEAERLLDLILYETDSLIREDRRQDIVARTAVIKKELLNATQSDERATLIGILSSQEQLYTVIKADNRFASTLIVPPYASVTPESPPGPKKLLLYVLAASLFVWIVLVWGSLSFPPLEKLLKPLERK